jgi:hypothetical protein
MVFLCVELQLLMLAHGDMRKVSAGQTKTEADIFRNGNVTKIFEEGHDISYFISNTLIECINKACEAFFGLE